MTTKHILPIAIALLSTLGLQAGGNHSDEKKVAGPNGGRLLTSIEPHAEFLLLPDRKVQITFVDDHAKPIPPAEQVVTVTTGERSAPLTLVFVKTDSALVSEQSVPAGNKFPVVVRSKPTLNPKRSLRNSLSISRPVQVAGSQSTPAFAVRAIEAAFSAIYWSGLGSPSQLPEEKTAIVP
jgi:hypothetical protein